MNVYVESNFVLELALEQEEGETCAEFTRLAANRRITLAIPAFSLAEPHQALSAKAKIRSRLGEDLRSHLGELGRSKPHRDIPATFDALAGALVARAEFERAGLRRILSELLRCAEVIPLDRAILRSAGEIELAYDLSGQDAIVFASVLAHLEHNTPEKSCFLSRNSKDFDDPDIRDRLEALGCKFFAKFTPALDYIRAQFN